MKVREWGIVLCFLSAVPCAGREIVVDGAGSADCLTIGEAIGKALPGDTITIRAGVYREEVYLEGKSGTAAKPIVIQSDPTAPPGSVVIDGSRTVSARKWYRFMSSRYGVHKNHNIWWTAHDPNMNCKGRELQQNARPYKLHKGWYDWDGSRGGTARWGACQLFKDGRQLQLVPHHPRAGKMSDLFHADSEETQAEDYITASNLKFLRQGQWIWYDDGRTDGADKDEEPVRHPLEIQHRIFVRLPEGKTPSDTDLSYTVRTTGISIEACSHITIHGLRIRRALTGVSVTKGCQGIRLQGLVIEQFGAGRKFYYSDVAKQHLYNAGAGIRVHTSSCEIVDCLIQNGMNCGVSAWGNRSSENRLKILFCTIRNIGPHIWGGGWAHGKGKGIGTGNFDNVLIAKNVIQNCTNCGYWIDGGSGDRNITVISNRFENCRGISIFSETHIEGVLVAYNVIDGVDRCFRIGPISRRSRLIGNIFRDARVGGTTGVMKSRMEGQTDTVDWFALVGNVFANCKYACFIWTDDALLSPHFYWDCNVWHAGERAHDAGPFIIDWRPKNLTEMWTALRPSGKFLAAGQHSQYFPKSPAKELASGKYKIEPDPVSLVTDEVLEDLTNKGFLTLDEQKLLKAWRCDDEAVKMEMPAPASMSMPTGWEGPGSPRATLLPENPRYLNRRTAGPHIRINVGYLWGEVIDPVGNVWLPDQIFEESTYGYIGEGRLQQLMPTVDISNTENDEIYRTGRTRVSHYVVTVPDGTYDVVLHFCNTVQETKWWVPDMDVQIQGQPVLSGLAANEIGKFTALRKKFLGIQAEDGQIEISLCQILSFVLLR